MGYNKTVRLALLMAFIAAEVLMAAGWLYELKTQPQEGLAGIIAWLGNLPALLGLPLIVLMVLMGSRTPLVERHFGLDSMMRLHVLLGSVVIGLFTAHGVLKISAYAINSPEGFELAQIYRLYLTPLSGLGVSMAKISLFLLLFGVGLAKFGRKLLPFNLWKLPHLSAYLVVILGLLHAQLTANIITRLPQNIVWLALAGVFLVAQAWRTKYLKNRRANQTALMEETTELAAGIHHHLLTNQEGAPPLAARRAGQFAMLRLKGLFLWSEPHPFTISSAPAEKRLGFSIRQGGHFTARLAKLKQGQRVLCEGPYGLFSPDLSSSRELIMIAGGIGVTPFLSIIRQAYAQDSKRPLTLIWSTKTRAEAFAAPELAQLVALGRLKLIQIISREEGPAYDKKAKGAAGGGPIVEFGRLDKALLQRHLEPGRADWWLCAPPAMQKAVLGLLGETFGVRPGRVRREKFLW